MDKKPILPPDPVEAAILTEEEERHKTIPAPDGEDIGPTQIDGEGEALDETRRAGQRGRTA